MKKTVMVIFAVMLTAALWAAEMPKEFSVTCGNLKVTFSERTFWNLRGVVFKGRNVTSPKSWYGTVTAGQPGIKGWVGSGHMENGIGEKNLKLSMKLDGKEWTPSAAENNGKEFELTKESDLGFMHLVYNIKVSGDTIVEDVKFNMLERKMILIYHFMSAFDRSFSTYSVEDSTGKITEGDFKGKEENIIIKNPKKFTAVSPKLQTKIVCELENADAVGKESYIRLHDRASFRKFYFGPAPRVKISAGRVYNQKMTTTFIDEKMEK